MGLQSGDCADPLGLWVVLIRLRIKMFQLLIDVKVSSVFRKLICPVGHYLAMAFAQILRIVFISPLYSEVVYECTKKFYTWNIWNRVATEVVQFNVMQLEWSLFPVFRVDKWDHSPLVNLAST